MNKVNCGIVNKISLFTVLSVFLAMVITPPLLSPTIHGAGVGLKINVHVDGAGKYAHSLPWKTLDAKLLLGKAL